ncbi:unnamed protein product [Effrenium voratum]|nr:unnamed protein product [Effrenium voratum]
MASSARRVIQTAPKVTWHATLASYALLLLSCGILAAVYASTKDWAVHTEEELLQASVLHPLFNTEEHFAEDYWKSSMQQKDRLEALTFATQRTQAALAGLEVSAFLESAGLIGWLRHNRSQLPWDSDGDLGIVLDDCIRSGANKESLQRAIDQELVVLKFACACEEDCQGDNKRMVGRVAHKATGVCIDIFAYAPVRIPRTWQEHYKDVQWWERVDDHADFTFPHTALLPLQTETFAGHRMLLPAQPREFLSWEYGRCLGAHVWPWRILLYTPVSESLHFALAAKGASLLLGGSGMNALPAFIMISCSVGTIILLRGGLACLTILALSFCELLLLRLRPDLNKWRGLHTAMVVLTLGVCMQSLQGSVEQLWCQVDDFYLHPRRPKSWTLCLLGTCWDF